VMLPMFALGMFLLYLAAGQDWWKHGLLFLAIFTPLYTSLFANLPGFAGGLFGALSYWMGQQAVSRGSQPLYYYAFLMVPVYEYLPALGALVALLVAWRGRLWQSQPGQPFMRPLPEVEFSQEGVSRPQEGVSRPQDDMEQPRGGITPAEGAAHPVPSALLFLYWSLSSLLAFSLAGEKMPWLTVDIAMPLILACAWGLGWLLERRPSLAWRQTLRYSCLAGAAVLAALTARAAYRAAFINYDQPLEYLVYAHSAPDPKRFLGQLEDLSRATTGGLDIVVAYDNNVRYPYWWYLRHYPKRIDYDQHPTNELRKAAVILVGEPNYAKIEPIVGSDYVRMDAMRLWWPNQDYWRLKWDAISAEQKLPTDQMTIGQYLSGAWRHVQPFFNDSQARAAVWQIWLNRDFSLYAARQNTPGAYTLGSWSPAERMRIYIRKDVLAKVYGFTPPELGGGALDPYQAKLQPLTADLPTDSLGLQAPRGLAFAPDGSLYLADSRNARILHLASDGQTVLQSWGKFADASQGSAPGGTFNEPWGVAVGPDGSVYVADTWNHRIQKFSAQGEFLSIWGSFGSTGQPDALWGPRGLAVDRAGRLYVTDTGNKRVEVFDANGAYVTGFGEAGSQPGQLDEPVGIALDGQGRVYVADTWNRRVQVFQPDASGLVFKPVQSWEISGWSSDTLENKPFLALNAAGFVLVTDPEACRVLEFTAEGQYRRGWTGCEAGSGVLSGLASAPDGSLWVSDAAGNRLLRFKEGQ
jgi:DNA-binding beta-propeller fold protein YncE